MKQIRRKKTALFPYIFYLVLSGLYTFYSYRRGESGIFNVIALLVIFFR